MASTIIDPTGIVGLQAKYKKALDKGKLAEIRLEFTAAGFTAVARLPKGEGKFLPISEAMALISAEIEERPFADEKAHAVSKFEVRLDKEAPDSFKKASSKEELDAAIASHQPFKERRAFQMSNKEFELAFLRWEDGNPVPRPAEEAESLRKERAASRGGGTRGRGRGGRGRGSFLAPEARPVPGPKEGTKSA